MGRAVGGLGLDAAAAALAAAPHPLLIAADVDGTLSPLVPRADQAKLLAGAREAIEALRGARRPDRHRVGPRVWPTSATASTGRPACASSAATGSRTRPAPTSC